MQTSFEQRKQLKVFLRNCFKKCSYSDQGNDNGGFDSMAFLGLNALRAY